jgi:uncharacterized protein (TIGR02246 family)
MSAEHVSSEADLDAVMQELAVRVGRLEDERAILDCISAFGVTFDMHRWDDFAECFTEDARFAWKPPSSEEWVVDVRGRQEIRDFSAGNYERGRENRLLSSPRVRVLGPDVAEAETWYAVLRYEAGAVAVRASGLYTDSFARCADGRWRIAERLTVGDMPRAELG